MSNTEEQALDEVCAACGKAAVDNVKLKMCTACELVKYCNVECQKNHWPRHKKACRKRAAEIRDDRLFRQPDESYLGECPICCLPMPINEGSNINSCCCKKICRGCNYENQTREWNEGLDQRCPYCRELLPKTDEEKNRNLMKRVKANDPVALNIAGEMRRKEEDYEEAFEYFTKAAELGDMDAHLSLSVAYHLGEGVKKDIQKEVYHMEEAAIGGHPSARYNLGNHEGRNLRFDRAIKHFIIAAKLGHDGALDAVKEDFMDGYVNKEDYVSKEDYEAALRGHQAAVDATKSEQRTEAAEFYNEVLNQD